MRNTANDLARTALEDRRRDLLRRWRAALAEEAALLEDRQVEMGDAATDQREAALIDLIGERELAQLAAIGRAFARLEAGQYGTCTTCGEPIGEARLRTIPEAELCLGCMEVFEEKRQPLRGRVNSG